MAILTAHMYNKTTPVSANSGSPQRLWILYGLFHSARINNDKIVLLCRRFGGKPETAVDWAEYYQLHLGVERIR